MNIRTLLRSPHGAVLLSPNGAKLIGAGPLPDDNPAIYGVGYKSASLYRFGWSIGIAVSTSEYDPGFTMDDVSPYLYEMPNIYRRFLHYETTVTITPDPSTGTDSTSYKDTWDVTQFTGEQSNTHTVLSGSGSSVPIGYYTKTAGGWAGTSGTITFSVDAGYVVTRVSSFAGEQTFAAAIAAAIAMYKAGSKLKVGSNLLYTYGPTGSIVGGQATSAGTPMGGLGHALGVGMSGVIGDNTGAGGNEIVAFSGAVFWINESAWYIQSQGYDTYNNITAVGYAKQAPTQSYLTLEDLTAFTEQGVFAGSPP